MNACCGMASTSPGARSVPDHPLVIGKTLTDVPSFPANGRIQPDLFLSNPYVTMIEARVGSEVAVARRLVLLPLASAVHVTIPAPVTM